VLHANLGFEKVQADRRSGDGTVRAAFYCPRGDTGIPLDRTVRLQHARRVAISAGDSPAFNVRSHSDIAGCRAYRRRAFRPINNPNNPTG
jgi:hypothetical protein